MNIRIRKEQPQDILGIHQTTVAAFLEAVHSDHTEQFIVNALRESGALSVSLVAIDNEEIVGHVTLSRVSISDGTNEWYGLGPISVLPCKQGNGIGTKLIEAAKEELHKIAAGGCVLLGDPDYYCRFGFKPLQGLVLPSVPAEYFQALYFQGSLPQGSVTYHSAFFAKA